MLTSLVLQLKSPCAANLPASLGRSTQAVLLKLLDQRDATLAEQLHEGAGARPYTASNLIMGHRKKGDVFIEAGQEGWLRFTGLTAEISGHLQAIATQPPATIKLQSQQFTVVGATFNPADHPWAGQISYQELSAPYLLGQHRRLTPRVTLEFSSPTSFRSQGRYQPLPLPDLVFGSLLDRWLAFSPVSLHPNLRRFAREAVALNGYQIRSRALPSKAGGTRVGFTGQACFAALNRDRYWLNALHLLASFSFYSGVGYGTTSGMGQCRRVES